MQWRKFVFFDKETVKDPVDNGKNFALPAAISVCDSGRGHIVLGDILVAALPKRAQLARMLSLSLDANSKPCLGNWLIFVAVFITIALARSGLTRMFKLRIGQEVQGGVR